LWEDFHRLWNAIDTERTDFDELAKAYAYILSNKGEDQNTINTLVQKSSPLTQKEYVLLRALLKNQIDAEKAIDSASLEKLESMAGDSDIEAWRIIAKGYKQNNETEKAARYYQLLSLHQIALKTMTGSIFDDIDNWLTLDSANIQENLKYLMPLINANTLSISRDDYESAKTSFIQKYCDAQTYEIRIHSIEKLIWSNEFNSSYNPLRFDLLKYYISSDKENYFILNFKKLLAVKEMGNRKYFIDYSRLASSAASEELIQKYFSLMQKEIENEYKLNIISNDEVIQNLSLIGVALYQNSAQQQANTVLDGIKKYIKEPSLTSLWLSDAMRICNKSDQADIIDYELNNLGLIPNARLKNHTN
jgi:hypothetical protein